MSRHWPAAAFAAVFVLAVACGARAAVVPTDFADQVVLGGLDEPRSLAFLPDGRILFVEQRNARVRMVVNGHLAAQNPLLTVPGVSFVGYERGLQSVAVDPQWPTRPYLYFFHNATDGKNKLIRYTASGALTDPNAETMTLGNRVVLIGDVRDNDPNHNSGGLRFGPDGMLYLSLGEDEVWCDAQDSTSLRGCILRLDVNGVAESPGTVTRALLTPPGNPLSTPDSNAKLVWAYGMRNPWAFAVDGVTGTIYAADVGEANFEEVNEVLPGGNYGWPYREGPLTLVRANCPEPGGASNPANGYRAPMAYFGRDAALHSAITAGAYRPRVGAAFNWPSAYNGHVFWGDYYDGWLQRLEKNAQGQWVVAAPVAGQPSPAAWGTGFFTMVDFALGPDGDLWWLSQFSDTEFNALTGQLHRVRYTGPPVGAPAAPARALTLAARPNPFRDQSRLAFTLPAPASAKLVVHDLSGRVVRTLLDGDVPAGETQAAWDGRDASGRDVAPGVYLARLELGGAPAGTARLMRLR